MPAAQELPPLRAITVHESLKVDPPVTKIRTDEDVVYWKMTRGYQDFGLFLRRLNESVVGFSLPYEEPMSDVRTRQSLPNVRSLTLNVLGDNEHDRSLGYPRRLDR